MTEQRGEVLCLFDRDWSIYEKAAAGSTRAAAGTSENNKIDKWLQKSIQKDMETNINN